MNRKRFSFILALSTLSILVLGASLASVNTNSIFASFQSSGNGKWVHYSMRNATSELDGIREYWVECGGSYQFTAPSSSNIEEASHYDTSEFTDNDPRWIKYIKNDKAVFYDLSTSSTNSCEIGSGYVTTASPSPNEGGTVKALFTKDDNSCWYYGDYLTVTKVINDGETLKESIWMRGKSAFFGYYVLGQDINEGFAYNDTATDYYPQDGGAFAGTLDGRHHTVKNVVSSYGAGIFGTANFWSSNKFGYVKNITFDNFSSKAYGFLGLTCQHLRMENVTINVASNCYYLFGYNYVAAMTMRDCTFDLTKTPKICLFVKRQSDANLYPTCTNVIIKNDLSKSHFFYNSITENYDEEGVTWTNLPVPKKEGELLFYSLLNNSIDTSEITGELAGYSFYLDQEGKKSITFTDSDKGTTKTVYALKDGETTYAIDCLVTSRIISDSVTYKDWCTSRSSDVADTGYYVLTNDFKTAIYNVLSGAHSFKGTFDGRGHTITFTQNYDTNYGVFGRMDGGSILKNLTIDGINRGYSIGWSVWSATLDNVTFIAADTVSRNVGLIANTIRGSSVLRNVKVFNKEHEGYPVLAINSNDNAVTYDNVTVECLTTSVMYTNADSLGQNPTAINYVYLNENYINYEKGVPFSSAYIIRYVSGDTAIQRASEMLMKRINMDSKLGFGISRSAITATTSIPSSTKAIIIGSTKSFNDAGFDMLKYQNLNSTGYVINTKGNAVYIMAVEASGYQLAINKFLEVTLGFDVLGINAFVYERDGSVIPAMAYANESDLSLRKTDAYFDAYHKDDSYSMNFNVAVDQFITFDNKPIYGADKTTVSQASEGYHTAFLILPAPTYYGSHRDWYGLYNEKYPYSDGYEKTFAFGALCYTARGSSSSRDLMVQTFAENIISECDAKNKYSVCVGNSDSDGYCKCSSCAAHNPSYNFITFMNDVSAYIKSSGKNIKIATLLYKNFLALPDDANLMCDDNITPFIAPISSNYYSTLDNATYNNGTKEIMEGWANRASTCYAWLYNTNFRNLLYPFASYRTSLNNIRYLSSIGYSMVWGQNYYSTGDYAYSTGFTALKYYLESKVMVDSDVDYEEYIDKFFDNYYGHGTNVQYMRTMFDEINSFINNRFNATSGGIGYHNDNEGNMNNNTSTGVPEYSYIYNWNYLDMVNWRTYCVRALATETESEYVNRIRAERIFPNWSLSTLFSSSMGEGNFSNAVHNELVLDTSELGFTKWKEGASIYDGGDNNLNHYFASKSIYLTSETLIYDLTTKKFNTSQISSLLDGYSFYKDDNKTALTSISGETYVYAMKDGAPTYLIRGLGAYVITDEESFNSRLNATIKKGAVTGYYAIVNDIPSITVGSAAQATSSSYYWSAKVYGFGHTIGTVYANANGLFGTRVFRSGATIKDLNINNVVGNQTQYLFGWHLTNMKLINVSIATSSKEGPLLAGEYGSGNNFIDSTFDMGSASESYIFFYPYASSTTITYRGVKIIYRNETQKLYMQTKTSSGTIDYNEQRNESGIAWSKV